MSSGISLLAVTVFPPRPGERFLRRSRRIRLCDLTLEQWPLVGRPPSGCRSARGVPQAARCRIRMSAAGLLAARASSLIAQTMARSIAEPLRQVRAVLSARSRYDAARATISHNETRSWNRPVHGMCVVGHVAPDSAQRCRSSRSAITTSPWRSDVRPRAHVQP